MDIGSILIVLGLALLALVFIAGPLVGRFGWAVTDRERRLSALQAERDKVLASIQEMEMDHTMGKIPLEDFHAQRAALVSRGAALLREIDQLQAASPQPNVRPGQEELEAEIEASVARLRQAGVAAQSAGFCRQCGRPVVAADRFCSHCGAPLPVAERQP